MQSDEFQHHEKGFICHNTICQALCLKHTEAIIYLVMHQLTQITKYVCCHISLVVSNHEDRCQQFGFGRSTVFVLNDSPIRISGTANDVGEIKSEVAVPSSSRTRSRIND